MSHKENNDLIYALEDRPATGQALYAGLQHVLASFVGIITPTLIIGGVLGLGQHIPYLISMALIVSGVGTFIHSGPSHRADWRWHDLCTRDQLCFS